MQLSKISVVAATLLLTQTLQAEDYVRVQYLQYNENDNRVDVIAPSIEVNKDFGIDYTLNVKFVTDAVSGASPTYSDTSSGASVYHRGVVANPNNIQKENIAFEENRLAPSVALTKRFENRDELTLSYSKSYESDYDSNNFSVNYLMWADESKNRSFDATLTYQDNAILIKECDAFNYACSSSDALSGASSKEKSSLAHIQLGATQILDESSLMKASLFYAKEDGYLSNPYYNIVRNGNLVEAERKPDQRSSYGFGLKYFKNFGDLTTKLGYSYYGDDWDITAHTLTLDNYYELNDAFTVGLGLRYYLQSEAEFYSADPNFFSNQIMASMDEKMSDFSAITYKLPLIYTQNDHLSYDIALNYYQQSTNLSASYFSVGAKYKF